MRKSTSAFEWVKARIWILLLIGLMVMNFCYLLGREGSFSEAAKAGVKMLLIYLPMLASVWFSSYRQRHHK
ncbi:hypothetical protein [uncultured Acetobacteroides sp.]|uniref:hypothetical protein n=1 Tax=uncultured Acetobacteroides sp. TaxID=1760811 RepID=UPI0029F5AF89|nr:hypothetical protein [uncultured Acetobacteroides sp.]